MINNTNPQKHSVTFYNKTDMCSGLSSEIHIGQYSGEQITAMKPMMVKIEPKTTLKLTLKSGSQMSCDKMANSCMFTYNNPYDDRFVVVKLPDLNNKSISMIDVSVYSHMIEEHMDVKHNVFFSFTDVLIILLLLCIILLLFFRK